MREINDFFYHKPHKPFLAECREPLVRYFSAVKFLLILFFLFVFSTLYAQESNGIPAADAEVASENEDTATDEETEKEEEAAEVIPLTPEQRRVEMEIKTSSLPELAAWCRMLGLSEGGTRTELIHRIRAHFNLPESAEQIAENQKIITIESARTTEYFTIDVVNEDYARLMGEVNLVLKDKDTTHKIKANDILFNRTRNIITARGGVEYTREKTDSIDIFRGQTITVNIDNWDSIFLDGSLTKKADTDGSAYLFSGTVITRNEEEVTILSKAKITNANDPEAYWSISASKVWLLPGSDFAIYNAVLNVGEIPVLYIPFLYWPQDEVVFHPAVGYRSREGAFVQTSTYILGRPKASETGVNSLTKILGNAADMEKERHGVFLRSTGKKKQSTTGPSLKALIDYYANLGAHLGLEFSIPKLGILSAFNLSASIGITRTLDETDGYTPFIPDDNGIIDGSSDWNKSNLFSTIVPFRYKFKTDSSFGGKYGNISWNITMLSDPFIEGEFSKRSEEMDWFNMVTQGAAALEEEITTISDVQSYTWQLSGSLRPTVTKLSPYISSMALNTISTVLTFKTLDDRSVKGNTLRDEVIRRYSPNRFFFAPDRASFTVSGSIGGTPYNSAGKTASSSGTGAQTDKIEDPLKGIGIPYSPWPAIEDEKTEGSSPDEKLVPPVLKQRFDAARTGTLKFSIDYSLSPTSSSELQFRSSGDNWTSYEEVDWSEVQSILTNVGGSGNLTFNLSYGENLFSNKISFSGTATYRDYSYINEEAEAYAPNTTMTTDQRIEDARLQQYKQSHYTTYYEYNASVRPLYGNPIFGQSNLTYGFRGLLAKSNFIGTGNNPEWENEWGAWEKEKLTSHSFATNIAANVMSKTQNLSVTAELPPRDSTLTANATLRAWISETNGNVRVLFPEDSEKRVIQPINLRETLRFGSVGNFNYAMVIDPENDNEITSITSSIALWKLNASFSAAKFRGYTFDEDASVPWVMDTEPKLNPRTLTVSYNQTFSNIDIIKNMIKFSTSVGSNLSFDLQRYTYSSFNFNLTFNLDITKFLTLKLTTNSQNNVIFRYFKDVPGMEDLTSMYIEGEQNNLFIDLMDSFDFTDEAKRKRSGFKLKGFHMSAIHHLGDWNAELEINLWTDRDPNTRINPQYKFFTELSFYVKWIPISEVKTHVKYNSKDEKWTKIE